MIMKKIYQNTKIKVYFEKEKCRHSANCLFGLPQVFDTHKRPWVNVDAAEAQEIKRCIDKCPSGALSCELVESR